jgi:hypothetical protein
MVAAAAAEGVDVQWTWGAAEQDMAYPCLAITVVPGVMAVKDAAANVAQCMAELAGHSYLPY